VVETNLENLTRENEIIHTPRGKCLIDDYSQRSLGLLIPGSRLNARNSPGTRP